jgi:hypothetical protein
MKNGTIFGTLLLTVGVAAYCAPSCVNCVNDTVCLHCQEGYWNQHCLHICPEGCNASGCDRTTGRCFQCNEGFYGSKCTELCPLTCLRVDGDLFATTVGGACTARVATIVTFQINSTITTANNDNVTETEIPATTTTAPVPRTPIPTVELRPADQLQFNCSLGCVRGYFAPASACRRRCSSGCALAPDKRDSGGGRCVVDPENPLASICEHGCQHGYGGRGCNLFCVNCERPADANENSCTDAGVCTNGCVVGRHGPECQGSCPTSCADIGCDQTTGKCVGCAQGGCGLLCTLLSGCQSPKCETKSAEVTPLGADCGACLPGQWGWLCEQRCPSGCLGPCDKLTGACLGDCRDPLYGPRCELSLSNCQRAFPNGTCQHCERFDWGERCNESCYSCEWPSDSNEIPEDVFTACDRLTGECRFGCGSCSAGDAILWTMLSVFVFLPLFIGLVCTLVVLVLRCSAARGEAAKKAKARSPRKVVIERLPDSSKSVQ